MHNISGLVQDCGNSHMLHNGVTIIFRQYMDMIFSQNLQVKKREQIKVFLSVTIFFSIVLDPKDIIPIQTCLLMTDNIINTCLPNSF